MISAMSAIADRPPVSSAATASGERLPAAAAVTPARVVVVIPCYEQAGFLPDTVASVCAQTYHELEIVVVDDGSPDDTAEVTERLAAAHPNRAIRLLRQANQGLAPSRNRGIEASSAEYVLPLDADDLIGPAFIEACVRELDARPDVSIAYGSLRYFGEIDEFHAPSEYDLVALTHGNLFPCTALYRRRAWAEVGGYDEGLTSYEDWDFWLGCGERGHLGVYVPRPVFYYRKRKGSMLVEHAYKRDQTLKAKLVLNHPVLFSPQQATWARGVLDGEPQALQIGAEVCVIPALGSGGAVPRRSGGAFDGARRLAVLAVASEVLDRPELLRAFDAVFGGGADATLVIGGTPDQLGRLGDLVDELGLDSDHAADLLGVVLDPDHDGLGRAAAKVDAILTEQTLVLPVPLPRFDADRLGALRRLGAPAQPTPTRDR